MKAIWIITFIFLLAAAVVVYVLYQTKLTLKNATAAADKADTVIGDVKGLGMGAKKAWDDITTLFKGDE